MGRSFVLQAGLFELLVRVWSHIPSRRRGQVGLLFVLMLVSAFFEIVSLGAVLPFLAVLTAPDRILSHRLVADVVSAWGITTADQLVLPFAALFAGAALVAGVVRLLLLWANNRLAFATSGDFSMEIYRRTLYQPYRVHVGRNSSVVLSGITQKVEGATKILLAQLNLASSVVLLLAIMLTLIAIDPMVAMVAGTCFGAIYGLITWAARRRLRRNSQLIAREQTNVIKIVQEGLGGIREILLDGTQPVYLDKYRQADFPVRHAHGNTLFVQGYPRIAVEALGMALIAALAYGLSREAGGVAAALPVLGALTLGAQRLLPVLQQIFTAWASITSIQAPVAEVLDMLDQPLPPAATLPAPPPLELQDSIRFEAIRFHYTKNRPWVLDGLCLSIPKGVRIGIIGGTGSGKSTALDLLMGLLEPTEGLILIDGQPASGERLRAWQRSIAHVPQSIYLSDSSIAENIAFGIPPAAIDMERVRQAAARAQIADFIENHPNGYEAMVGERGIRLSGGQRQRIGIARALYKQASVLVFDEATSALDNTTEQAVMEAIESLDRDLTILIIAHRLTTVQGCDRIIELVNGRAVEYQSYEQMMEMSPCARKTVAAG